jgi:hypothetical protein
MISIVADESRILHTGFVNLLLNCRGDTRSHAFIPRDLQINLGSADLWLLVCEAEALPTILQVAPYRESM